LVARLAEKIDDLKTTKIATSDYEEEENSSPSHDSGRDDITTCDKSENEDEEGESEEDEVGEQRFVAHTYYRHKFGEGFAQRQPSDLASSKPTYLNIDDQVARSLANSKFATKHQEYSITVENPFFAAVTNEAQKDVVEAFEAGNYKTAHKLFKQVSNDMAATSDMQGVGMLFLNINSDPGATTKQKSFPNDIMRNDFTLNVTDRGVSASTQKKFRLYEEQCLKATLGEPSKAHANRHLST
jgi:hypothetical protein